MMFVGATRLMPVLDPTKQEIHTFRWSLARDINKTVCATPLQLYIDPNPALKFMFWSDDWSKCVISSFHRVRKIKAFSFV